RKLKARTVTREVGDMFEYRIDHPVTIDQNRSALVPIVSKDIDGQPMDLYNEKTSQQHPLAGIRLKNTTGLTLEGGPLTVLQGGTYAGEALIKSLKPDEQRYITYAVDLGLHVNTKKGSDTEPVDRVVINRGLMRLHRGIIETRTYNLNNKNAQARTVVIEHPYHSGRKLLEPKKPLETTDNYLRFEVTVPGNEKTAFVVKEMRDVWESFSVSSLTPDNILIFARQKYLDDKTLKQLEKIVAAKAELARIENELETIQKERAQIFEDQKRLRENLRSLGQTSEEKGLRSRYIHQLDGQETRLSKIDQAEENLKALQQKQRQTLETLMGSLSMDLKI
ncbi:conserved domain protein, partial [delta proteobacterium NaphS2]